MVLNCSYSTCSRESDNIILLCSDPVHLCVDCTVTYVVVVLQRYYGITSYLLGQCRERVHGHGGSLSVHGNNLSSVQAGRGAMR